MLARWLEPSMCRQAPLSLTLLIAVTGCPNDEGFSIGPGPPPSFPTAVDAGASTDRLLPNYELVDIPSSETCERLPLGPGLLAPDDTSTLLCTRHGQCPAHDLCSARIRCHLTADRGCEAVVISTQCAGDECQGDQDCQTGSRCSCEAGRKECQVADCLTDSECAAGQRCRPTWLRRQAADEHLTCNGDVKSYACSTPEDECTNDEDCQPADARCGYDLSRKRFACLPCSWRLP